MELGAYGRTRTGGLRRLRVAKALRRHGSEDSEDGEYYGELAAEEEHALMLASG